ncbi:MAG: CDP-diacylglycerol--glycerol-3-phosphate 3-phosphatidyltransferase [Clostridia bacterium]|nr:CDP-diacylglycerol--glycerol-3-phosphate 3-phosphatidyltransferase [Clostridia bacterium]
MNIPNILTLIRIALIPVTAYMFYLHNITAAVIVFMVACVTDILDGFIARRFNMVTDLGKVLDPLADKGMQMTVLFSMAALSYIPWAVVIVIICKELLQFAGGAQLYSSNVIISANWYGKVSTVVTSVCVIVILLFHDFLSPVFLTILQWLPVLFAAISLCGYFKIFLSVEKDKN